MDPALRETFDSVQSDGGEEMATIAWSYAAAVEIGIDATTLFHEHGYNAGGSGKGGGGYLAEAFTAGRYVGTPLLEYWGMAARKDEAEAQGIPRYPHMLRWLR
jgi:hypothetical protein